MKKSNKFNVVHIINMSKLKFGIYLFLSRFIEYYKRKVKSMEVSDEELNALKVGIDEIAQRLEINFNKESVIGTK